MAGHSKLWLLSLLTAVLALPMASANAQYYGDRDRDRGDGDRGYSDRDHGDRDPGAARFETVAEQTYDRRAERVVFRLAPQAGRLAKIKIKSLDGPLLVERIQVRFSKSQPQDFNFFDRLGPGEETGVIDLDGGRGIVTDVIVVKRPSWRPGQGRLALVGEERFRGPPPDAPRSAGGQGLWETIAGQSFDRRAESVTFRVDPRAGRTGQIRIRAVDDPVILQGLQVRFANGGTQRVDIFDRLGPGEETAPIDVEGAKRAITEVVVFKRPSWRPGQSRLELQALGDAPRSYGVEAGSAPPGWMLFGVQTVDFRADKDVISVGHKVGQFERIALAVHDNDIFLRHITIVYGSGDAEKREINALIPAESRTRPIDLKGDRFISRIELVYQSRPDRQGQRAVVELYGDFAEGWFGERGAWRNHNEGWVMLGAQRARLASSDKDTFPVGNRIGPIGKLKIVCRRHAVRITGMRVTYGSGRTEAVPILADLNDGSSTPVIPLARGERFVKSVELRYRTKLNFSGEGIVELWGAP